MTYTRVWRVGVSPNRPRNQMDDSDREIRVDIEERMQDLIGPVGDWTTDPVDSGANQFYQPVHWSAFRQWAGAGPATNVATSLSTQSAVRSNAGTTITLTAQLPISSYGKLVDVVFSCHAAASTSVTFTVYKISRSDPTMITRTSLATRTVTGATAQGNFSVSSGANINETLDPDNYVYFAQVAVTNSTGGAADFGFQGALVSYTRGAFQHV